MQIILVARLVREHHYSEMLFKVNENHKIFLVLDKNASAHGPVFVDAASIMLFVGGLRIKSNCLSNPVCIIVLQVLDLSVRAIEVTKYLHYFPFDLELGLFCHKGREWSAPEVTLNLYFKVGDFFNAAFDFHYLLIDGRGVQRVKFVAVPEVECRV